MVTLERFIYRKQLGILRKMAENITQEQKLSKLLEKTVEERNGNRIRHLTRVIAKSYSENPEELKEYFDDSNKDISGIATSAYNFLTKEISPIQAVEFGGLGAILDNTEEDLEFNRCQLWFSKNSGYSLWCSKNSGNSLRYSENSGSALKF